MNAGKRKLLILASTYPRWRNDHTPAFVHDLAVEFLGRYEVTVLAPHTRGARREEVLDGVKVVRFRYAWPESLERLAYGGGMLHNIRSDPGAVFCLPAYFLSQLFHALRISRRTKPEVIHSHWLVPQGATGAIASRLTGIPHVVTVHGGDYFALARSRPGKAVLKWILNHTDAVVSVSSVIMGEMENLAGRPLNGMVAPMGVRFSPVAGESLDLERGLTGKLAFVGRLVEKKGVPVLLRALSRYRETDPAIRLDILGDGPLMGQLRSLSRSLKLETAVNFLGAVAKDSVIARLHQYDALVVPSIVDSKGETEGMPVVILEAMSVGLPVIATDIGGIADVVRTGHNGWLVKSNDARRLADAIAALYGATDLAAIRKGALETASSCSVARLSRRYVRLFDRLGEAP